MECTEARNRLHAYLDSELEPPSVVEVDRHIAACAACRRAFEQMSALRSGVRAHAQYHAAPAGLEQRIRGRLGLGDASAATPGRHAPWRSPFTRWLELGAVAAATAAVTWFGALQYAYRAPDVALAEQVVVGHARAVLTSHVVDIETSDQHSVKPWLSSRLDFSPPVVDLASEGFPLVGGRLDYLDHRPVAALVFRAREHVIDLYVWPDASSPRGQSTRTLAKQGYNVVHWSDAGMQYWAISDLNAAELATFAAAYSAAR
jgi:anti-sigma factor (TIGR02949 family)